MNKKDWYTPEVRELFKELEYKVNTTFKSRVFYIYTLVKELVELSEDYDSSQHHKTKLIIKNKMQEIADDLGNYKIFDKRFEDPFDEGR